MSEKSKSDLTAIIRQFQIAGEFVSAEIYGSDHVNDTYHVSFNHGGTRVR